ncbi:hypothetical protein PRIPAC_81014 [Pristionchus pacificus]|nr:hypothetical protein PRIPAC_81014 [Pristionchus pacificus]
MAIPLRSLFLILVGLHSAAAYTYSCNALKNLPLSQHFDPSLIQACVILQEGYSDYDVLENVFLFDGAVATSFATIARAPGGCVSRFYDDGVYWRLTGYIENCAQELTLLLSFDPLYVIHPRKGVLEYTIKGINTFVVPQTGMKLLKQGCNGSGHINVSTGAGINLYENRYPYHSWTCDTMPDTLVFFDTVITIEIVGDAVYTVKTSSDLATPIPTSTGDSIFVYTSGKSNDQQNMMGYDHRAKFELDDNPDLYDVKVNMDLTFDNMNSMVGFHSFDYTYEYYHGTSKDEFRTDYFEILYQPVGLKPEQIATSGDVVVVELKISGDAPAKTTGGTRTTGRAPTATTAKRTVQTTQKPVPTTTVPRTTPTASTAATAQSTAKTAAPATTTSKPKPVGQDSYCNCAVDKFGFPDGWNFNEIWLDIVVILDTSEAMGENGLLEAGAMIESFISDGVNDFLVTDPTAQFYTRVGVISMSDKAEVLYDLNMTKADSIQGKASIKKGVKEINIVDAFDAALNMFTGGYKDEPNRVGTRPVIYYMTSSNPGSNLLPLNQFKASQGIIIVDNFLEEGQVELPRLKELASDGYYYANSDYLEGLQAFCKANCFCQGNKDTLGGFDPAVAASGGCYHPSPSGVPFNKAKSTCVNEGGIIATVHDDDKGRYLQQLMAKVSTKSSFYWIGYEKSSDGSFQWEDESNNPYTNWDVDEPSTADVAKCTYVDSTSLAWGAGNCQLGFPYVCQYTPCSVGNKRC